MVLNVLVKSLEEDNALPKKVDLFVNLWLFIDLGPYFAAMCGL